MEYEHFLNSEVWILVKVSDTTLHKTVLSGGPN